jgi:hypothetical protein
MPPDDFEYAKKRAAGGDWLHQEEQVIQQT